MRYSIIAYLDKKCKLWYNEGMNIGKKFLILLFSSFVGIISNPELPFASDSVIPSDISGAVETVLEAPKPVETVSVVTKTVPATTTAPVTTVTPATPATPAPVAQSAPTPVATPQINRISIAGRSLEFVDVANTGVDSGNHVNRYNSKFFYGHNSANVFRPLYNVGVGDTFSVTENDTTKNYQVKAVAIYEKVNDYTLRLNGQELKMSVVARARYSGVNYDISVMTCYGTSYGNGDASHRLVLFANAI